jgi:hypothetical protein
MFTRWPRHLRPTVGGTRDNIIAAGIIAAGAAETDVTKQTNKPWLTDELLERVFG